MLKAQTTIKIDHAVLRVSDISAARSFYGELFNYCDWETVPDPGDERSIGFRSNAGFTLWLDEVSELNIGSSYGWLDHFALHCESREAVNLAFDFCQSKGWEIITEPKAYPDYGNFYGFSFKGPDGIKLEFVTR